MIYLIIILVMVLSFIVQIRLNSKFSKYSRVASPNGITGAEISRMMLQRNGVNDVSVGSVAGKLTDHYDPTAKVINLSESVYGNASIAACAVAAHETGHALQHAQGYGPLRLRSKLVPVVNFANNTIQWLLLVGILLLSITPALLYAGIALFALTVFFSFVTLPVEINASRRAVAWLESSGMVDSTTKPMAEDALKWAAYTYVIAAIGSLATLLYYISIAGNRR